MPSDLFVKEALNQCRDRLNCLSGEFPDLHHVLVMPSGSYIRIPGLSGCLLSRGRANTHTTFGATKVYTELPPSSVWSDNLAPAFALVADGSRSSKYHSPEEPHRVHLFFGDPKGFRNLLMVAKQILGLSADLERALYGPQGWSLASILHEDDDTQRGDLMCNGSGAAFNATVAAIDDLMSTVHFWAWKAVDSPIHTQPLIVFG